MKIRIIRNYQSPNILRQTPGSTGHWKGLEFSEDKIDVCDLLLVLNRPNQDLIVNVRKGGVWAFIQEPPIRQNRHITKYFKYYDKIISAYPKSGAKNINMPPCLPWLINKTYDDLKKINLESITKKKTKNISWITSNTNVYPGHKIRLDFIDYLKSINFSFDLFGRGFSPIKDKYKGLENYKYSISAENFIADNYFTEKLIDPLLSWTMPFYYGCPNFADFLPKEAIISIDLADPKTAIEIMDHAVRNDLWKKNSDAIEYARELILDKFNIFPFVYDQIANSNLNNEMNTALIPADGMNNFERKIRTFVKRLNSK